MPFHIDASDGTNLSGGGNEGISFFGNVTVSPESSSAATTISIINSGSGFYGNMIVKDTDNSGKYYNNIQIDSNYGNGQQKIVCTVPTRLPVGNRLIYICNPDGEYAFINFRITDNGSRVITVTPNYRFKNICESDIDYVGNNKKEIKKVTTARNGNVVGQMSDLLI